LEATEGNAMKYIVIIVCCIALLACGEAEVTQKPPAPAAQIKQAAETFEPLKQSDALKSIIALNYCTFSLAKIEKYSDRIVLDEEYTNIVNAINLKNIPDQKVIDIIKQLMDTLTAFRLSEMEKEKLFKAYEDRLQEAMMTVFREAKTTVPTTRSGMLMGVMAGPVGVAVGAGVGIVASGTSGVSTYMESKVKLDDHTWSMSKEAIQAVNELNKSFMGAYWAILQGSDVPEKWRVTSAQIEALLETAKEADPVVRHRVLIRLEKECGFIPAYWHYRADAAHSALQRGDKGNFVEDIALCLERYDSFAGFLRKDPLQARFLCDHLSSPRT